jgi:hypothetical protein
MQTSQAIGIAVSPVPARPYDEALQLRSDFQFDPWRQLSPTSAPVTLVRERDPFLAAEEHAEKLAAWLTGGRCRRDFLRS